MQRHWISAERPLAAVDAAERRGQFVAGVEIGERAAVSERRNVQHDQVRIDSAKRRVVESKLAHPRPGPSEHRRVGPSEQPLDARALGLKVEEQRALAAIERMEMRRAARASAARRFHLDGARALLGEQHRGVGRAQVGVEFDQVNAVESLIHRGPAARDFFGFAPQRAVEILTRRAAHASAQKQEVPSRLVAARQ